MAKLQYEVFLRSAQFERAAADMRLRPIDWRLLLALDGRATLGDLADRASLDVDDAVDTIALCERLGIVERRRVLLAEYRSEFEQSFAAAVPAAAPARAPEAVLVQPADRTPEPAFREEPVSSPPQPANEPVSVPDVAFVPVEEARPVEHAVPAGDEEAVPWGEGVPEAFAAADAAAEDPFPVLTPDRQIADLPLDVIPTGEAAPEKPGTAAPAPAQLPETLAQQIAAAAPKPIEFKLRPSVQVIIR